MMNIDPTAEDWPFMDDGNQCRAAVFILDDTRKDLPKNPVKIFKNQTGQKTERDRNHADFHFHPAEESPQNFNKRMCCGINSIAMGPVGNIFGTATGAWIGNKRTRYIDSENHPDNF